MVRSVNKLSNEKVFYLIGGPNGSGKTTLTHQIIKLGDIKVLDMDGIAAEKNISSIAAARQLLKEDLPVILGAGDSFVLESTLSGTSDARIIKMAQGMEYKVVFVFVFLASVEQNIERVAQRVNMGGHGVNVDIIRRRYDKSLNNFHKIVPLVDRWVLFYNGESGKSYKVAGGDATTTNVEHAGLYKLFQDNCFTASVNMLPRLAQAGATDARVSAERAGVVIPSVAAKMIANSNQK